MVWPPGLHADVVTVVASQSGRGGYAEVKGALPSVPTDTVSSANRRVSPASEKRDGQPSSFCVAWEVPATPLESGLADEENCGGVRGQPRTLHVEASLLHPL